jgi:transcriptional regulator with XRE-family HTH domain
VKRTAHPILKRLGETVRLLRLQHGLSQEALAELAGIDRSYMSGIERGLRNLSILQAMKISTALHVAVHELLQPATTAAAAAPLEEHRAIPMLPDRHVDLGSESFAERLRRRHTPALLSRDGEHTPSDRLTDWTVGQYLSLG